MFDFSLFIKNIPHANSIGSYYIAKSFFDNFECKTLGDLKSTISIFIQELEGIFKELKTLTNLSNKSVMPTNLQEFTTFKAQVLQGMQSPIINSFLGFFGYSALHNDERVKTCIIAIVKYHAYLTLLEELFATCSDHLNMDLQSGGNLQFSLEHANNIQVNIIK